MPIKIIKRNGKNISTVHYDRNVTTSFKKLTFDELVVYRTLMRQVGGMKAVSYELYKQQYSLTDNTKVSITFFTIHLIKDEKDIVLSADEFGLYKHHNKLVLDEDYTIVATDKRVITAKRQFQLSLPIRKSFINKVNISLNCNNPITKDTYEVIKILNKLARRLTTQKETQLVRVNNWLQPKEDKEVKQKHIAKLVDIKNTIDNISVE